MKLYEHESAEIFGENGIPVPEQTVVYSPEEAKNAADKIGYPVIVKSQVLVGGRGLAGGVKPASNAQEAFDVAEDILGSNIKGLEVKKVMVSRKVKIEKEFYMGITIDGYDGKPVVMVSSEGGMNIEEVARSYPERIATMQIDITKGMREFEAKNLLKSAGFPSNCILSCVSVLVRLYRVFIQYNAMIAEINPLVMCEDGKIMAVDAKIEVDDSALFRLKDILPKNHEEEEAPLEKEGREIGVTYVDLDGDIGIIASGAGLGMSTMDMIGKKFRPANFLETGGGMTDELLYKTFGLIAKKKDLRAIFINVYGGINPIHEGAKGVSRFIKENDFKIPVIAKALGNRQEETWEILRSAGVYVVTEVPTEKAVDTLFEVVS